MRWVLMQEQPMNMEEFIHRRNLERFRELIEGATNEAQRKTIERLIAEEVAWSLEAKSTPPRS
jgi:hypothetical protein